MCRLLGVVSTAPIAVSEAVGACVLKDFVALTKIHGDGWGIATRRTPGRTRAVDGVGRQRVGRSRFSPQPPSERRRSQAWSTCAGPRTVSRCSRRTPILSSPTGWPWRTTVPSSRWARSTGFSSPTSPRRCAGPPTASATSA